MRGSVGLPVNADADARESVGDTARFVLPSQLSQKVSERVTNGFLFLAGFLPPILTSSSSLTPSCATLDFFFLLGVSLSFAVSPDPEAAAYPRPPNGELAARASTPRLVLVSG